MRSKLYYMVLCRLPEMLKLSSSIPSGANQIYYRLLLSGTRVEPGLPDEEYLRLCGGEISLLPLPAPEAAVDGGAVESPAEFDDDPDLILGGEEPPEPKRTRPKQSENPLPLAERSPPAKRRKAAPKPRVLVPVAEPDVDPPFAGGGRPGSSGDAGGGHSAAPPPPPPIPPSPEPGSDSSDGSIILGLGFAPARSLRGQKRKKTPFAAIGGGWIKYDPNWKTPSGKVYPNFTIGCTTCAPGSNCKKTQGQTAEHSRRHGRIETIACLHAWRTTAVTDPAKSHARHTVPTEEVDAYIVAHRADLERLADAILGPSL